jgi:polyisoprenoid-binding protein YceI
MEKDTIKLTAWTLDKSHSEIHFRIRHMMISWVGGYFTEFDGRFESSDTSFRHISVDLTINVDSISTGNANRDEHLKSIDFFDAGLFPEIRFQSDNLFADTIGKRKIIGDLSIHGITRSVELDVEFSGMGRDPWGNEKAGFSITGEINRKDFDINWNAALETGGVLIGEEVQLRIELQLLKSREQD